MTAIDVGSPANDRASSAAAATTWINLSNPANASGILTELQVYVNAQGSFKVATVANTGWNVYYVRGVADLGVLTVGYHDITGLELPVATGDVLAWYSSGGKFEADTTGGTGIASKAADTLYEGTYFDAVSSSGWNPSIYGVGSTQTLVGCDAINEAMDSVRDNYLSCVSQWFLDNWPLEESENFKEAMILYMADTISAGAGGGLTLEDLQTELATLKTDLEAYIDTQMTALASWLGVNPLDVISLKDRIDTNESNCVSASDTWGNRITNTNTNSLQTVLDAIPAGSGLTQGDLDDAVTTINGHSDTVEDNLRGASQQDLTTVYNRIPTSGWATPTNVTDARDATIDNLNGSSNKTLTDVFDHIVTSGWATPANLTSLAATIMGTGAPDIAAVMEAVGDLADLIPGDSAPVWPGLANVTLGTPVALADGLHLTEAMDGVLITVTTPPSKTGLLNIGGKYFDYREGEIAFETDNGEVEPWQYLGFRNAIFTPKTMTQAAGCRLRVLAGAEGIVTPWTKT